MKSGQGSKQFWGDISDFCINNTTKIDFLGISIIINAFGRSPKASMSNLLSVYKPIICGCIDKFKQ